MGVFGWFSMLLPWRRYWVRERGRRKGEVAKEGAMSCSKSVAEASSAAVEGVPPDRQSQKNSQGGRLQAILKPSLHSFLW